MFLQTERLLLRPVRADDANDLFRIYGDPATNTFNPAGPHPHIEHSRNVLAGWLQHWQEQGFGNWAIALPDRPNELLGFGGIRIVHYDTFSINNLGYRFATTSWGKGYATEFARANIVHAFQKLRLADISAVVRKNHQTSRKVLEKCGLQFIREIHDIKNAPPSLLYNLQQEAWRGG